MKAWLTTEKTISAIIGALVSLFAAWLANRIPRLMDFLLPSTPAIAALGFVFFLLSGLVILAWYREVVRPLGRTSWPWRLSGIGVGLVLACAIFLGGVLLSGQPPQGEFIHLRHYDNRDDTRLYIGHYSSNGLSDPRKEAGRLTVGFQRRFASPPHESDAIVPFEAGILLQVDPRVKQIELSEEGTLSFLLRAFPPDTVETVVTKLGFGLKSVSGWEVKYPLVRYVAEQTQAMSSEEMRITITLQDYPSIVRSTSTVLLFTLDLDPGEKLRFQLEDLTYDMPAR